MWRFLRNRRLLLRLVLTYNFQGTIYWAHRAVIFAIAWLLVYLHFQKYRMTASNFHGKPGFYRYDHRQIEESVLCFINRRQRLPEIADETGNTYISKTIEIL